MKPGIFVFLTLAATAAAAGECVKTGTVCVEAGGTRLVDGIPVTRDCWSERDTYACLEEDSTESGCAAFESAPEAAACTLAEATCDAKVTDADTGLQYCLSETQRWHCKEKIDLPSTNAAWESEGPVTIEAEDASACAALAADSTCRRISRTCSGSGADNCTVTYECDAVAATACSQLAAAGCKETQAPACADGGSDCRVKTGEMVCEGDLPEVEGATVTLDAVTSVSGTEVNAASCAPAASARCQEVTSVCSEKGGRKVINGRVYYERCWAYTKTYECSHPAASTCDGLAAAGCEMVEEACSEAAADGTCLTTTRRYRCAGTAGAEEADYEGSDKTPDGTVTVSSCAAVESDEACSLKSERCLAQDASDATKCREREMTYVCGSGDGAVADDCAAIAADAACRETDAQCLGYDDAGNCTMTTKTYVCEAAATTESLGEVCGTDLCLAGVCRPQADAEASKDFLESAAVLEIMRQAGAYGEVGNGRLFTGAASSCSVKAAGFSCCRTENAEVTSGMSNSLFSVALTTGIDAAWQGIKYVGSPYVYDLLSTSDTSAASWLLTRLYGDAGSGVYTPSFSMYGVTASVSGGSLTLSFSPGSLLFSLATQMAAEYFSCTDEDRMHALRRSQNLCHYVGSWCKKKGGSTCLEKEESWCCFNSRLALVVQTEGRKQLGIGWGTPEAPACRGFTIEEFQALDFSKMDLTPVIAEMAQEAAKTVDSTATAARAQSRVAETAADPDAQYRELTPFTGKCGAGGLSSDCTSLTLTGGES